MRVIYMDEPHAFRYLAANVFGVQPSRVPSDIRDRVTMHPCICQAITSLHGRAAAPKIDSATRNRMERRVMAYVDPKMSYAYERDFDGIEDNDVSPEARMGRAMACLWLAEEAEGNT